MGKPEQYTAKDFLDAIPGSGGIITTIARRVGCAWHTAAKYIDKYVTVRRAVDDEHETMLDIVEGAAFKQARDGDGPMIRYILSTKGKERGYTERHEVTGDRGGPVEVIWVRDKPENQTGSS